MKRGLTRSDIAKGEEFFGGPVNGRRLAVGSAWLLANVIDSIYERVGDSDLYLFMGDKERGNYER
jgi:hypothetical protein